MDCKKIILILISFLLLNGCYKPIYSKINEYDKKIQIKEFLERVKFPFHGAAVFISYDLKRKLEDYIIEHAPLSLVLEGGDIIIGGKFVDCSFIEREGKNAKIKIIVNAYCKDKHNSQNNWVQDFEVIEDYYGEKDALNEGPMKNKIINNLVSQLYNKTIEKINFNKEYNQEKEKEINININNTKTKNTTN
ncbi:hypothetical protein [Blattabacterium cuenoti]|uniref:hypothetical protein n=1 Tax=Blattabacterium cuenoti TaxID=1653831 RepID=UPI00163CBFF4|nr:hypothetical protein [Blattabacterium cuenoti]